MEKFRAIVERVIFQANHTLMSSYSFSILVSNHYGQEVSIKTA